MAEGSVKLIIPNRVRLDSWVFLSLASAQVSLIKAQGCPVRAQPLAWDPGLPQSKVSLITSQEAIWGAALLSVFLVNSENSKQRVFESSRQGFKFYP